MLILTVHVEDMAEAGSRDEIDKPLVVFNKDFMTNDLGELSIFIVYVLLHEHEKNWLNMERTVFINTLANRFEVTTTSRYPASPNTNI